MKNEMLNPIGGLPTLVVTGTIQNYSFNFNPVTGNLNWRQNNKYTGLREDFQYDDLDRLTDVLVNSVTTLSMSYDENTGGITAKSDAGAFTYDSFERPYAIETIDPTTGLVPDSTQTTGYTSFNKVESISENGYEADFIYGTDDLRSRMIVKQDGNTILTRWYPTGSYMKETAGGVTKEYTFIGGDAYTAPAVAIKQSGSTVYYSILRDHLGSITHVVDSTGAVVAEYSYDAWGRMRNPTTWVNYEPGSEPALMIAGRGFTGHEHLPWFNTINMNGRLYDPLVGMFLSPDNYIQSGDNSQNFNRYSYGLNNPLRYSDPTGMLLEPLRDPSELGIIVNPIATEYLENIYSVGGGGGHYGTMGSGFYYTGNPYLNVYDAVEALNQSQYGGSWFKNFGIIYYYSDREAFNKSCAYIDYFGYWGSTKAKNYDNAYSAFTSSDIRKPPKKRDLIYYASLDGIRDPESNGDGNQQRKPLIRSPYKDVVGTTSTNMRSWLYEIDFWFDGRSESSAAEIFTIVAEINPLARFAIGIYDIKNEKLFSGGFSIYTAGNAFISTHTVQRIISDIFVYHSIQYLESSNKIEK